MCLLFKFGFAPRNNFPSWNWKQQWQLFCMLRRHYLKSDISYPRRLRNRSFISLQRVDLQLPNCSVQLLLSNPVRTWCIKVEIINFWHEKFYTYIWLYAFKAWAIQSWAHNNHTMNYSLKTETLKYFQLLSYYVFLQERCSYRRLGLVKTYTLWHSLWAFGSVMKYNTMLATKYVSCTAALCIHNNEKYPVQSSVS